MSDRANDQPFDRGQTYYGPDQTIDQNDLKGGQFLGMEKVFEDYDYSAQIASGVITRRSGRKVTCRLLRNTSGITILGKRLCIVDAAGLNATGITTASYVRCAPLDEWLPSTGLRNGDIGWFVVDGPAMLLTSFGADLTIAAGDALHSQTSSAGSTSGASTATNGRPTKHVVAAATTAGQFTDIIEHLKNYVGTAISARTTGETHADILVDIRRTPG
jgi:hypothetical protein